MERGTVPGVESISNDIFRFAVEFHADNRIDVVRWSLWQYRFTCDLFAAAVVSYPGEHAIVVYGSMLPASVSSWPEAQPMPGADNFATFDTGTLE